MTKPTLFLTVGLPGSGKTTDARRVEQERGALRLTKDEWMKALFGDDNPSAASDVIEARLIAIALRTLELGLDVILDFGLWSRDERTALRWAATSVGASVVILYNDVPAAQRRARLLARLADAPHETWPMSDDELRAWADQFDVPTPGELDATEPLDEPPPEFGTWAEWMADRWPPAVRTLDGSPARAGDSPDDH